MQAVRLSLSEGLCHLEPSATGRRDCMLAQLALQLHVSHGLVRRVCGALEHSDHRVLAASAERRTKGTRGDKQAASKATEGNADEVNRRHKPTQSTGKGREKSEAPAFRIGTCGLLSTLSSNQSSWALYLHRCFVDNYWLQC